MIDWLSPLFRSPSLLQPNRGNIYLTPQEMEELSDAWKPYRSVACWCFSTFSRDRSVALTPMFPTGISGACPTVQATNDSTRTQVLSTLASHHVAIFTCHFSPVDHRRCSASVHYLLNPSPLGAVSAWKCPRRARCQPSWPTFALSVASDSFFGDHVVGQAASVITIIACRELHAEPQSE